MLRKVLELIHFNAVDAIISINPRGLVQTINPATETMFGYAEQELIGQNIKLLMPEGYRVRHDQFLENYQQTRVAKIIGIGREVIGRKKDGSEFPIHLAVSEIQTESGWMFVGFIRDLSEYKALEAELQKKLLINERLAAIGQMVSGLAHESRNAFQRSHACLEELALDLTEMPASLGLVRKVQRALDDLHNMLEEVRSYAAPIILERRECSLVALVGEAWQQLLEARIKDAPPDFELIQSEHFPARCMVDGDRLKQVFRNLLDNAWFACQEPRKIRVLLSTILPSSPTPTPTASPTPTAFPSNTLANSSVDRMLSPPVLLKIEVIDSGTGIPAEHHEQIFEPFFTTKTKGTGLGLPLCRRYVEAHGGTISIGPANEPLDDPAVQPTQRSGSCIVIQIPLRTKETKRFVGP